MTNVQLRSARQRRAVSLIEMMVVIALSGVLLGLVVSLAAGLMQWDHRARNSGVSISQRAALAATLRDDIRRAADVTFDDVRQISVIFPDGNQATYELDGRGCVRTSTDSDRATLRTERFTVGVASLWELERLAAGRRTLVSVVLQPNGPIDSAMKPPPLVVYAALAANSDPVNELIEPRPQ